MLESRNIYAMFGTNDNLVLNARVNIYPRRSFPTSDKKYTNKTFKERKFHRVETVTQ
jgi:hypothetical protein